MTSGWSSEPVHISNTYPIWQLESSIAIPIPISIDISISIDIPIAIAIASPCPIPISHFPIPCSFQYATNGTSITDGSHTLQYTNLQQQSAICL